MSPRRVPIVSLSKRAFHSTPHIQGPNPLFHLQGLSTSRETQWLSKASGLSRVEHSPGLQLLRSEAELQQSATAAIRSAPSTSPNTYPPPLPARRAAKFDRPSPPPRNDAVFVKPWVQKMRRELEDMDKALTRHTILKQAYGGSSGASTLQAEDALAREYEKHIDRQEREIATLRRRLDELRAIWSSDLQTAAAVKQTINNYKERAEAAGALAIVVATLLGGALYYQHTHPPTLPVSETPPSSAPNVASEPVLSVSSLRAKAKAKETLAMAQQQQPSGAETKKAASDRPARGFFWQA